MRMVLLRAGLRPQFPPHGRHNYVRIYASDFAESG
jgi:hypothetical protein